MKRFISPLCQAFAALSAATLLFSCSDKPSATPAAKPDGPPVVQATNYPLAYFAKRIAGDFIDLQFLPEGEGDPAFWEPSDEQVLAYQSAALVLLNGASYEKWMATVTLPTTNQTDTSKVFSSDYLQSHFGVVHSHGPGEAAHSHGGTAFTTWMDFQQAMWQAEEVRDALIRLLPDKEAEIRKNFDSLADDLEKLHTEFKKIGQELGNKPFMVSHPVYQYFARRYDLNIDTVLWEPEVVPDEAAMKDFQEKVAKNHAKWMIWEGDPAPESVEKLKALGISSLVVDPCGNAPDSGDWLSVMQQNAKNLEAAVDKAAPEKPKPNVAHGTNPPE